MLKSKILKDINFDEKLDKYHEWKESFIGKIETIWDNFLGNRIYNFKLGCKNIIRWFPIIWKDRDYDASYALDMLKQKLYFMCKLCIKNERHEGWERDAELMTLCIKLIGYIQEEHYSTKVGDFITAKYGETIWEWGPYVQKGENTELSELKLKYPNIENGTYTKEEYDVEYRKLMDEAYIKEEKAKKLLFHILNEKLLSWWD